MTYTYTYSSPSLLKTITPMISCRSLIRFHTFRRLSCTSVTSSCYQECELCHRNLSYNFAFKVRKFSSLVMDQRRQRGVTYEWRSISTQAASSSAEVVKAQSSIAEGDIIKSSISMEVGASLMRFIKGKWGETQKKIEDELEVKLLFPSSREEDSIMIEGNSAENVAAASEKVQAIIDEVVNSPNLEYSHFVSLPLAIHPELVDKLANFQNSILGTTALDQASNLSELGIEKSIFINPRTFHLTVLMLKLWNKERIKAATEVLQGISSDVMEALDSRPVFITLKGLQSMSGSWSKARILYAPVEEVGDGDRLIRACQVITKAFIDAGLVLQRDERHKLLLHATIMNARHRKRNYRTRNVDSFDARGIMEQYGFEEWGEYLIREAHLSRRFVHDESGYYHCCASIPFPKE